MSDYESVRAQLLEARKVVEAARLSARQAQDRAKALAVAQKKAARSAGTPVSTVTDQSAAVPPNAGAVTTSPDVKTAQAAAAAALAQFAPFTDPRNNAQRL